MCTYKVIEKLKSQDPETCLTGPCHTDEDIAKLLTFLTSVFRLSVSVFPMEIAHTTLNTQNEDGIAGVDMSIQEVQTSLLFKDDIPCKNYNTRQQVSFYFDVLSQVATRSLRSLRIRKTHAISEPVVPNQGCFITKVKMHCNVLSLVRKIPIRNLNKLKWQMWKITFMPRSLSITVV